MTTRTGVAQGDVLLVPISEPAILPDRAPAENGRLVLAHGEHTGHHHSIDAQLGRLYRFRPDDMPSLGSVGYLVVDKDGARLEHLKGDAVTGEHDTMLVAQGWYRIQHMIEESDDEEDRLVQD